MAQLTAHSEDHELGVAGCDTRHLDNAKFLCEQVLEPIRAKFGPVHVHDGYRDPGHNAAVDGKTQSFHLFIDGHAAADVDALPAVSIPALLDWLRLESGLAFDKVILETNSRDVPACVHIQIDRLNPPRRQAFIGHTGTATSLRRPRLFVLPEAKRLARPPQAGCGQIPPGASLGAAPSVLWILFVAAPTQPDGLRSPHAAAPSRFCRSPEAPQALAGVARLPTQRCVPAPPAASCSGGFTSLASPATEDASWVNSTCSKLRCDFHIQFVPSKAGGMPFPLPPLAEMYRFPPLRTLHWPDLV